VSFYLNINWASSLPSKPFPFMRSWTQHSPVKNYFCSSSSFSTMGHSHTTSEVDSPKIIAILSMMIKLCGKIAECPSQVMPNFLWLMKYDASLTNACAFLHSDPISLSSSILNKLGGRAHQHLKASNRGPWSTSGGGATQAHTPFPTRVLHRASVDIALGFVSLYSLVNRKLLASISEAPRDS
jgi:hypothetical protein